jgi:hypothetical protein
MTVSVPDLPPPHELWAEPALLAALVADRPRSYLPGYDVTADGLRMRDVGNGWWGLLPVTGGRAVLYGLDLDYSEIVSCEQPVDLLAGGPAWLPWSWLRTLLTGIEPVGFVYWWDGAGWARAPYPAQLREDGRRSMLDGTVRVLADAVDDLAEGADAATRSDLLTRLRGAARDRTVDRALFEAVEAARSSTREPAIDPDVAVAAAARAGLTAGSRWPEQPAGDGEPAGRTVPFNGPDQHAGLVARVMRDAPERPRPPVVDGDALRDLVEHLRAEGTAVLTAQWGGGFYKGFCLDSTRAVTGRPADLLAAVRDADAHPESGSWLYLRVTVTATGATVERSYDRAPDWWQPRHPSISLPLLREESAARTERWRPEWAALLDESLAESGAPPPLCAVAEGPTGSAR